VSAHTWLGRNVAKLDDAEMVANRRGNSNDARADAAVRFARQVMARRGHVSDGEFAAVRAAGYSNAEVVEIVQHVALNTWTNYLNSVARTVIDFPVVAARQVA
jgi:alkylhydroperoxidase family enzyme